LITEKNKIVALIDGDVIAYRAAAVCEESDPDDVIQCIRNFITKWAREIGADKSYIFMSEGENFRHTVYPEYKTNRIGKQVPRYAKAAKEWMLDEYEQVLSDPLLEADDRMSLYATETPANGEVRIIVTTDKDMRQVPAYVFNPDTSVHPDRYTDEECAQMLFYQWVVGDPVDGYKGIPGVGVEKYRKWLTGLLEDREDGLVSSKDVMELYASKDLDPEYCIQQLYCATIKHNRLPESLKSINHNDFDPEDVFSTTIGEARFWMGVKAKV